MSWLGGLFAALTLAAGFRYLQRRRALHPAPGRPRVDDDALRQILATGSLRTDEPDPDDRLDLEEAARAEEEFWSEGWDEAEEFGR